LLKHCNGDNTWNRVPRTYIILRVIGQLDVLDKFIELGFSDQWFPVTSKSLPQILSASIREKFVGVQDRVLTKSIDLEKGESGRHRHFVKGELLPFKTKGILGTGGSGQVDRVVSLISYKEYARKSIPRKTIFGLKTAVAMKEFSDEVAVLKRLKHRHMVEFIGSYTDAKYLALLMSPIAEMDLENYLQTMEANQAPELRTYFGCLASALSYLHDNNIRHKDIKPGNILVDHGNVLFTDFGLARDSSDATGSTTAGESSLTPRYCAPEVANWEPRNTSSDIWSLGCVFLEMVCVLKGVKTPEYRAYFLDEDNGNGLPFVRTNMKAFENLIAELKSKSLESDNKALVWVHLMCTVDRFRRPTSMELVQLITAPNEYGEVNGSFCGICCLHGEESDISSSEEDLDGIFNR
jgi:serine/threonine protein kinase